MNIRMSKKSLLKIGALLVVLTVAASAFAGCKSKTADINSFADANGASGQTTQQSSSERKAQFKKVLDPLVKKSTITQAQEDKILTLLTSGGFGGMRSGSRPSGSMPSGNAPAGSMPSGSAPQGGNAPESGSSGGTSSGRRTGEFSLLKQLVSNGTITQAQSDAVMKAISSVFSQQRADRGFSWGGSSGQSAAQQS